MINLLTTLIDSANVAFFIGTILLIKAILKNRKILNGYDPIGSFLTLLALCIFQVCYLMMGNFVSFSLALVTVSYWVLAVVYSVKLRLNGKKKKKMHTTIYWFNGHGHKGTIFIRKDENITNVKGEQV